MSLVKRQSKRRGKKNSVNGLVTTDIAGANDFGQAVALQIDGKIIVAGYTSTAAGGVDFAVIRYNANGTLDTSFGVGGSVTTNFSGTSQDQANGVVIQAD